MWDRFASAAEQQGSTSGAPQIRVLYDDLLQNFQGLVMSFDAATSRLPEGVSRKMLDGTLERADMLLRRARISIQAVDALGGGVDDKLGRGHVEEHQSRCNPDTHRR